MLHAFALGLLLLFFFPVLDKTVFFGVDSCSNELNVKTGYDTQRLRRLNSTVFVLTGLH